jgi:hypothetical protein
VAPLTAFLALPAQTPLKTFYLSKYKGELHTVTEAQWSTEAQQLLHNLQVSMEHLHGQLSEAAMKKLKTKRNIQDARALAPNFEVGDFVLVGRTLARGNKLALEWIFPCRVAAAKSRWFYDVQTLFEPTITMTHHVSRLKFYVDKERGDVEDLKPYAVV